MLGASGLCHQLGHFRRRKLGLDVTRLGEQPCGNHLIEIITAEHRITTGRQHLKQAFFQLEQRNIKGTAAQIIDGVHALHPFIEAIGQRSRGRFIDQAQHFKTRQTRCIFGGGASGIVKIGRHGNHRLFHFLAQRFFC